MFRGDVMVGVVILYKLEVQPFTEKQIELVETFADQAVIAIENVRLFEAEQQRTRELSESLEQQTATSEVLHVISSSPGELDPIFPQIRTNSNGLGARHNGDQCFACHAQPVLGGSGGFLVPNPGEAKPMLPENPQFRLMPHRFGKQNTVPTFEKQHGPIREVRFKYKPDGTRDGGVHQLWVEGV